MSYFLENEEVEKVEEVKAQDGIASIEPLLDNRIVRAIREMGFEKLSPIQEQAIPYLLQGEDIIGQAQTGTGKTAAFGIPAIQHINPDVKKLQTIILCPTRELAIQAAEELRKIAKYMHGIKVLPVYGGQDISRQIAGLRGVQIIVGTPGRVMDHMRRRTIKLDLVNMVVLDEADEMLNMGFREDMELILGQIPGEHQTALFSATMPKPILEITDRFQNDAKLVKVAAQELTIPLVSQKFYRVKNQDKDVVLVSSGAIGVGSKSLGLQKKPKTTSLRQACAAVGQGQLMMVYQRLFYEYHQIAAQVLLTFDVITSQERRHNAVNTFNELLQMDVIPVVNENDTVAIEEVDINFGDNDTLSAIVANMINADLLLLLTDIDGLYTDDPRNNPDATLIPVVERIDDKIKAMAKGAGSGYGTGGMTTKISAAKIAANSGADMLILSGDDIGNLGRALNGESVGTLFKAYKEPNFDVVRYITHKEYLQ